MTSFTTSESTVCFLRAQASESALKQKLFTFLGMPSVATAIELVGFIGENRAASVARNLQAVLYIIFDFLVRKRRQGPAQSRPADAIGPGRDWKASAPGPVARQE